MDPSLTAPPDRAAPPPPRVSRAAVRTPHRQHGATGPTNGRDEQQPIAGRSATPDADRTLRGRRDLGSIDCDNAPHLAAAPARQVWIHTEAPRPVNNATTVSLANPHQMRMSLLRTVPALEEVPSPLSIVVEDPDRPSDFDLMDNVVAVAAAVAG